MDAAKASAEVTPLRAARREFTRGRIFAAAKEVFFYKGFERTNLEDIALAAGTKRSTVYSYFRDKDEIIEMIADDYSEKVREMVARLSGPAPTMAESDRWIEELGAFVERERTPSELFMALGSLYDAPPASIRFGTRLLEALAERVAAFERALKPGEEYMFAWATVSLREVGWALSYRARHGNTAVARQKVVVASEIFGRFVRGEYRPL